MTQNIIIKKNEGDQISFKLRKIESLVELTLDEFNRLGITEKLTKEFNKEFDEKENFKSEKTQNRIKNVLNGVIKDIFPYTDLSEYPILWNNYNDFKKSTKGKKEIHFGKLSEIQQKQLSGFLNVNLFGGNFFPKGLEEGNKWMNGDKLFSVMVNQKTHDNLMKECKENGYSGLIDKYGKECRVELYSDGTLFEPEGIRPIYTLSMMSEKHPDYLTQMETSFQNKIQKEVWEFYKDNGRSMVEFMEQCWTPKMESFHMLFEKDYGKEDKSGEVEYQNLDGIRILCEYLGFEQLNDDTPWLVIGIPKENDECSCESGKSFKDCHKEQLFKHFPFFEKMYEDRNGEGIVFNVSPNRYLEKWIDIMKSVKGGSEKEKELVG